MEQKPSGGDEAQASNPDSVIKITVKFQGKDLEAACAPTETVAGLKRLLEEQTSVVSKKQKLLGLKTLAGKPATDDTAISDLSLKAKILLMGTPEDVHRNLAAQEVTPHVQVHDDLDDQLEATPALKLMDRPEIQEKLKRRVSAAIVKEINPPRPGKFCAVFDIDYTIFALDSKSENPLELARPFLHDFFAAIYPFFDIVIWSATGMKWIDTKLREIGVSGHTDYKITACMDYTAMVTVDNVPGMPSGRAVFDCKPLHVLWERFKGVYTPSNTIMMDDLRRNYVLNPQQGLVIRPFKRALTSGRNDRELLKLKIYMLKIAELETLEELNHDKWEKYVKKELRELEEMMAQEEEEEERQQQQ